MAKLKYWVIASERGYLHNCYREAAWCAENDVGGAYGATLYETEDQARRAIQNAYILLYERRQCYPKEIEVND